MVIQPYMQAYMLVNGIIDTRDIKAHKYISWITTKHLEFRKIKGLRETEPYNDRLECEFRRFIMQEG